MDPEIALNRGYWEDSGKILNQWIKAYKEIAKKHVMLVGLAHDMINRAELACSLLVSHATFYDTSRVDECFYAEAVERENKFLEKTEKARKSLDGDFPCGNEDDMRFARDFFTIHEMAYLQMGLAKEVDFDNTGKKQGRNGFLHECLGHYEEAIACYEAMDEGRPVGRINRLREKLSAKQ